MTATAIEFRNVSKRYGEVTAVNSVSFAIAQGTLVTLLRPSGCGKTTTLRLIAGLELPSTGTIHIAGADVTADPASQRDVSMVFQSYALFPHMTVLENVRYGLTVARTAKAAANERAHAALATVGLAGFDARLPSELSGGQQQRVAVARALVLEPAVLLFDEPLSNLDARLRRQMRDDIRELQQRLALTVVYVTHDQAEALAVSDRIIVMNKAVIAQEGTPRELYERPRNPFVAGFMGDANRIPAVLERHDGELAHVRVGSLQVTLPHLDVPPGAVEVAVRPEALVLARGPGAGIAATVRKAAYLGATMEYTLDSSVGELFAVSPAVTSPFAVGDALDVTLARHGVGVIPPAQGSRDR